MRHLSKSASRGLRRNAGRPARAANPLPTLAVTTGEPAGIGPDICAMLALRGVAGGAPGAADSAVADTAGAVSAAGDPTARLIFLGDPDVIAERIRNLGLPVAVETLSDPAAALPHRPGVMQVLGVSAARPVRAGRLDPGNARYVLDLLDRGVQLCADLDRCALVTGPVQKSTIHSAGFPFTGHTEWLAARTGADRPVMMLASPNLRVALVTTHLPLSGVSGEITAQRLEATITVLHEDLRSRFGIDSPRIMVLGLNPHAGEDGVLGREETEIVEPLLRSLARRGLAVSGPVPADTAFTPRRLRACDAVLAMYHDQGLPVIKALAFGETVNVTLGLPIVRTSVDHGTALDLAGSGGANPESMHCAAEMALKLVAG